MNKFLSCRGISALLTGGLIAGMSTLAVALAPQLSPVTLSSVEAGKASEARFSLMIDGENFECLGSVTLGKLSILTCGDQRQAQAEFKTYNENKNGVMAVYRSGRQQGYLFLMEQQGSSYAANVKVPPVLIPGFGSLRLFESYVLTPMGTSHSETEVHAALPLFISEMGRDVSISQLRDRVANKEYVGYIPEIKDPEAPVTVPVVEVPVVEEPEVEEPEVEAPVVNTPVAEEPVVETPVVEELPDESQDLPDVAPRPTPRKQSFEKETQVRVYRGAELEIIEVPKAPARGFFSAPPARSVIQNPYGYDLRRMSLEEIQELERQGLITRTRD